MRSKAEAGSDLSRELVGLAEKAIAADKVSCFSNALLGQVLSKAGMAETLNPLGTESFPSPAAIFDAFAPGGAPALRRHFGQFFEVVAAPGEKFDGNLQPGDLLVRRAWGEGGMAHVALLVTGEALQAKELASMGLRPESWRPGLYAEVIDSGPFPHRLGDKFARRLGNENGQLGHDSLILRIVVVDTPVTESEMAAYEHETEDLGSTPQDFSLQEIADGTLGKLPDDILTAILNKGESDAKDLTNRVFWQNHPDLSGQTLDPKARDRKTQALREEWGRIFRRQVKPIIWLRQLIDELDRHRRDIPREFLLGWIAVESDGKVATISTLGERGYFQIMWQGGEAKLQLGLTETEFRRLSTDRVFSIEKGIQLAEVYRRHFLRRYPAIPDGSDLLWRLTKGRHALPSVLDKVLDRLVKAGTAITWQAVAQKMPKMASGVNRTLDFAVKLKPLADRVPVSAATTPEFYSESPPWFPGRRVPRFEAEIFEENAGNGVDEDAAEPLFTGLVRKSDGPLPDIAALRKASSWNQKMHPAESGIALAELRARLELYIDRSALDDLVRQANAGAATPPYGSDEATIVTLLADQFQRKTCRMPTVGEIWKPPTMGGMVAEDTLDALGFIYHTGSTTVLNLADRVNRTADETLKKVKAGEFQGVEPGLTAKTWWTYMVRPPWLGMPIKHGIHLVLLKRLRRAQQFLMNLLAYENLSPAELGKVLGLEEEHKGARPGAATRSMHTFGLAIDISYTHNPWLSNPERDTSKIAGITLRAAQFIGGKPRTQQGITANLLHQIAVQHQDTAEIYKILSEWSNWLGAYFALATDLKRLESQLPVLNAINPDIGFIRPGESLAEAAKRHARVMKSDFDDFATAVARGGDKEAVRKGFMDLPRDLVLALREYACLAWGAVDFGPNQSGDVMHFDCRADGIGRAIRIATGEPPPAEGHRCIPTKARKTAGSEFVEDAPKTPPPPLSFQFTSTVIRNYKDENGTNRSTNCAVAVPEAARNKKEIDLLVFFHGLDTCDPSHDFDARKVMKNFELDTQVDTSKREVALAVPAVYWVRLNKEKTNEVEVEENKENIRKAWFAAQINAFVEEVLDKIGEKSSDRPSLRRLILAGHSRAYDILTPLANEFVRRGADTIKGALTKIEKVLALDTTYGLNHAGILRKWADKLGTVKFLLVLSTRGYDPKKNDCSTFTWNDPPIKYWDCAMQGVKLPANLEVKKVSEKHCQLPKEFVRSVLTSQPGMRDPEWLGSEDDPTTPILHLEKVKVSGLPEIILMPGSGRRYEGFFATPIHLRRDQTSYAQSSQKEIEITGRIQMEDAGTRRNYDSKKDGTDWHLGGSEGSAPVKVVSADGPSSSTAFTSKVRPDGTFTFSTNIGVDGYTRSLTIYPKVELKGGKTVSATIVLELLDLDGFLALADPKEKVRPASQTHLEFLASVRKIYQGGPNDPLSGAFDWVLYRNRKVKPLVAPGTVEDQRFQLYKNWVFADREWVDIGHVLTGIEGSPKQEPSKDQSVPLPRRPELLVTWAGDLGSALQAYIKDFWNAIDTGNPLDLNEYLRKRASQFDLTGDIDGINIGSVYDASRSLAGNLRAYYGQKSRRRYHEFIANSKDENGKAELSLVAGKKPPQLSKQARQAIAVNTREFLVPLWIYGKLYGGADPAKRKLIDEIMKVDSPEMDMAVEYFVRFLEDGLVREP